MKTNYAGVPAASKSHKSRRTDVTRPHVAVAPGLLDADHTVIREPDDTDANYEARKRLFAAALGFARKV